MNDFEKHIEDISEGGLHASSIDIIQVNVGLKCNQQCIHCHLDCGPARTEVMEWPTMKMILKLIDSNPCGLIDITGGTPELNPDLPRFIEAMKRKDINVQVRTNLTVLLEPGMENIPEFYQDNKVRIVASMPCYLEENVCTQRGAGVYEKSTAVMKRLNSLGYGSDPELILNLVYNPGGAFLPPDQASLEADYKRELGERFGIIFNNLLTITNMPIGRFWNELKNQNKDGDYLQLLKDSFNKQTVDGLMCRHQVNIGWDGTLFDCDFNLALGYAVNHGAPDHISRFDTPALTNRRIVTGEHCFGCTAGAGSSCGGALA